MESSLTAALCSLEVSNRTTPVDSKYVSHFFSPPFFLSVKLIEFCSSYTKQKLVGLHPNVMVQRSPSHFQTGTFYWAHVRLHSNTDLMYRCTTDIPYFFELYAFLQHEKMCVIDQTIAFMGGLDLCFGR